MKSAPLLLTLFAGMLGALFIVYLTRETPGRVERPRNPDEIIERGNVEPNGKGPTADLKISKSPRSGDRHTEEAPEKHSALSEGYSVNSPEPLPSDSARSGVPLKPDQMPEEVASAARLKEDPSIGTVRILGHHGCDLNTQGWFLSSGTPEQYDFSVSRDGETLVVKSKLPKPTGNFEFVHCADPGPLLGKKVRLSVEVRAQNVNQTAQLRLRGEDLKWKKVFTREEPVTGTYDWKMASVEAEVGREVTLFSYGLTLRSAGKLWFRRPTFEVVP